MAFALFLVLLVMVIVVSYFWRSNVRYERERFIRRCVFPATVFTALRQEHAQLSEKDCFLIARALRTFFLVYLRAETQMVAMPSKAADALWHAFILDTRAYAAFCNQAFGRFLHHLPAEQMQRHTQASEAMRCTWRLACLEDNIRPAEPTRLALLFAIDDKLAFPGGNRYHLNGRVKEQRASSGCSAVACGSSDGLGCGDAGGGSAGHGGGDSGGGDGGGCGGGCGS